MLRKFASALSRFEGPAHAVLRIVSGGMFSLHGMQKILGWLASHPQPEIGSQLWFGGLIEMIGGMLIAIGLFTRPAAFLAAGTMAVAYFQFHWKLAMTEWKWLPLINQGELAVLYCFVFLVIATRGPGLASIDRRAGRA